MPGKSLPHTKQTATSADLEWGSDSLSRIYKAMTPGQEDAEIFFPKEDIIKTGNQYKLVSKSGDKNLGTYDTKAAAKKRERQVQYFKRQENADMKESYLTEFGDRPYSWRMTVSRDERYQAQFTVPGSKIIYTVSMWATKMTEPGFLPPLPIEYEFGFSRNNAKTSGRGSFSFGGDTTIIGKTGVEIPVFATVVAIFKAMVKVAKPKRVVYTAKGASRQRLYSRLTRMIQRVIPGYKGFEVKPGAYEIRSNRYVPEEHTMSIPTFREYLYESNDATPPLVTDVPPPEMEAWMRENKASYVKQHGEETGMVRLTAAAWDIHNREKAKQDSSMEPTP